MRWFCSAPVADACDRYNAPIMQLLMLVYALFPPIAWGWRFLSGSAFESGDFTTALMADAVVALLSMGGFMLIRRGRFRASVILFVASLLCSVEIQFLMLSAPWRVLDAETPMALSLVISGVMLGRRMLWLVFGAMVAMFASGYVIDFGNGYSMHALACDALQSFPSIAVVFLLIALVLDRYILALRERLLESEAQERQLRQEMEAREHAQVKLIHAQKMQATGRLASGIAHDFNNVLDVILGYAAQRGRMLELEGHAAREEAITTSLTGIEAAAMRGVAITRKLLAFNRHERSQPQVFDATQAIVDIRPMLRQLLPPHICLAIPEEQAPAYILFDRGEFELMLLNIAANARDAMSQGGRFAIRLVTENGGRVCISLSDTGHGMNAMLQKRIFEPFFSTKRAMGGTGLGLAVIHDLLMAAGGSIAVESEVGNGSTFHVRIPSAEAPAQ
ncbi:hypothetical protein GCM10027159_09090 [Lysobacter terrae]